MSKNEKDRFCDSVSWLPLAIVASSRNLVFTFLTCLQILQGRHSGHKSTVILRVCLSLPPVFSAFSFSMSVGWGSAR